MTTPVSADPREDFPMTDEELARRLGAHISDDCERAHGEMDDILVTQLKALGYTKAMKVYEAQVKWYA